MTPYKFGTVFSYKDKEYIFLAGNPDSGQIYAAWIFNLENSRLVNDVYMRKIEKGASVLHNLVYSFVVLETKELKGRVASLLLTGRERLDSMLFNILSIELTEKDLRQLKDEITKERCAIIKLKELVKGIKV